MVAATPDVSAITATISSLNTQLTKLNASKSEENMLASRVKQADDALKQIMEAKNPHTANITQLEKTLSETRKTFKELKESMGEAKARHELLERAKAVYAPSGVRSHILASITPFLNAKTSEYLSRLASVETSVVCLAARSARSVSLVRWRFRIWWPTVRAKTSSYSSAMK